MSDEGKVIGEKLEKRYQEISAEMQKLQQAIEEKENRLRTQDRLMSAAAKTQLNREINDDKVAFDRRNEDYQRELSELQNRLLDPVAAKAQAELATFVNEKGYTLLLDLSAQNGNVVWANPANDVTAEVLKRMNQTFKQGGTPAPAADSPNAAIPPVPSPQ